MSWRAPSNACASTHTLLCPSSPLSLSITTHTFLPFASQPTSHRRHWQIAPRPLRHLINGPGPYIHTPIITLPASVLHSLLEKHPLLLPARHTHIFDYLIPVVPYPYCYCYYLLLLLLLLLQLVVSRLPPPRPRQPLLSVISQTSSIHSLSSLSSLSFLLFYTPATWAPFLASQNRLHEALPHCQQPHFPYKHSRRTKYFPCRLRHLPRPACAVHPASLRKAAPIISACAVIVPPRSPRRPLSIRRRHRRAADLYHRQTSSRSASWHRSRQPPHLPRPVARRRRPRPCPPESALAAALVTPPSRRRGLPCPSPATA